MRNDRLTKLSHLLQQFRYRKVSLIKMDEFGRFKGIISDRTGKEYFLKAVFGKNSYKYKSLYCESQVTQYLSVLTKNKNINHKRHRLYIPCVERIINQDDILCLITHYIQGKKLSKEHSDTQADILLATLDLVTQLNKVLNISTIRPYLKNYTLKVLLLLLPVRFIKAVASHPFATSLLTRAFWKALPLFSFSISEYGLIHSDITVSNIIFYKNAIYLTDWEEAGWGVSLYNNITPLCVHWQNRKLKDVLFRRLKDNGQNEITIPLLAYRTLMLFNQNIKWENKKQKRDILLLKFLKTI